MSRQDGRAFRVVFERHFRAVHSYLRRRVSRDLAADLVAETLIRAFQHRARYREGRHYSCRFSCGGSVVLVYEAAELVASTDLADRR